MKSLWLPIDVLHAERVVAPDGSVWLHALVDDDHADTVVAAVRDAVASVPDKCKSGTKPCHVWLGFEDLDDDSVEREK